MESSYLLSDWSTVFGKDQHGPGRPQDTRDSERKRRGLKGAKRKRRWEGSKGRGAEGETLSPPGLDRGRWRGEMYRPARGRRMGKSPVICIDSQVQRNLLGF